MASLGIHGSGSAQPIGPGTGSPATEQTPTKTVPFGSGSRPVSVTAPSSSLLVPDDAGSTSPENTAIGERKTENVQARLRNVLNQLKSKAQPAADGIKGLVLDIVHAGKAFGESALTITKAFVRDPKDRTLDAAGKLKGYAGGKLTTAKRTGIGLYGQVARGLSAVKSDPKDVLSKAGENIKGKATSLKERAISLPETIKNKIPALPRGDSLPNPKALFSRFAKPLPSPSASVQKALKVIKEVSVKSAGKVNGIKEDLEQAKADLANLEALNKLLDNKSAFNEGENVKLSWNSESSYIGGDNQFALPGQVGTPLRLVKDNEADIRKALEPAKQKVSELESQLGTFKTRAKDDDKLLRKKLSASLNKTNYVAQQEALEERASIKEEISSAKQSVKDIYKGRATTDAAFKKKSAPHRRLADAKESLKNNAAKIKTLQIQGKADQKAIQTQSRPVAGGEPTTEPDDSAE